jgi:hypothetical protein
LNKSKALLPDTRAAFPPNRDEWKEIEVHFPMHPAQLSSVIQKWILAMGNFQRAKSRLILEPENTQTDPSTRKLLTGAS